jgi:hypothetical protein
MKQWIIAISCVLLTACQTGADTTNIEQAATSGDCVPGGNYADAKLPSLPLWNGSTPDAKEGQLFLDMPDWRPNTQSSGVGFHIGVLADPGTGKILWGATVPDGDLASFRVGVPIQPQIGDCCRPPPCKCRGCCDPGLMSSWMARNSLEASLRYLDVRDNAMEAAGPLR